MAMIACELQPLTEPQEIELKRWMGQSQRKILERVAEAKMKKFGVAALTEALEAQKFPAKTEAANASLAAAQKYSTFLEVLKELLEEPAHQTAKLT